MKHRLGTDICIPPSPVSLGPWGAIGVFMPLSLPLSSWGLTPPLLKAPHHTPPHCFLETCLPLFTPSSGLVLPRNAAGEEGYLLHHPHRRPRLRVLGDRPPGLLWQGTCPSHTQSPKWARACCPASFPKTCSFSGVLLPDPLSCSPLRKCPYSRPFSPSCLHSKQVFLA